MKIIDDIIHFFDPEGTSKGQAMRNYGEEDEVPVPWQATIESNKIRTKIAIVEGPGWEKSDVQASREHHPHSTYFVVLHWLKKRGRGGVIYGYQGRSRYTINSRGQVVFLVDHNPSLSDKAEDAGFVLE